MSLSFLSSAWQDVNQGGRQRLFGLAVESRYNAINESLLSAIDFDNQASSLEVFSPPAGFGNVVLCENGDFSGSFCQVASGQGSGAFFANLTDFGFNDKTRSMLLVRTSELPEFRISFRDQFLDKWNSTIDNELGSDASRVGDPLMTWEMFPESVSYLDPSLPYLKIQQSLNINVPDWWDYDAWIKYHVFLYLDDRGLLHGTCVRWEYWIEGGVKHDRIKDKFEPKVIGGANTLSAQLEGSIGGEGPFRTLYYLPGRQTASWPGVTIGSTDDDVTIVLGLT